MLSDNGRNRTHATGLQPTPAADITVSAQGGPADDAVRRRREAPEASAPSHARELLEDRAIGCLVGQFAGDSLGSQVEYLSRREIMTRYPNGVSEMRNNPQRRLRAGQPTDDSEMAMTLARSLIRNGCFRKSAVEAGYRSWIASRPVDMSRTSRLALGGIPQPGSMSNGAIMRVAPLGIFATSMRESDAISVARCEASITHVHRTCLDANAIYVLTLRRAILTGDSPEELWHHMCRIAELLHMSPAVHVALRRAGTERPRDYQTHMGFVLIALQNAVYELLHAPGPREGIISTIRQGGDTDTNAAVCGALLGAVHGSGGFPAQWTDTLAACTLRRGECTLPRPEVYWPTSLPALARELVAKTSVIGTAGSVVDDLYDDEAAQACGKD